MSATAWKAFERWIGKRWGGERVPVTGRVRGYAPDVKHNVFAIEAKTRKVIPAWLHEAIDQAEKAADWALTLHGQVLCPVVMIHQDRTPYDSSYILMPLVAFEGLAKQAGVLEVSE